MSGGLSWNVIGSSEFKGMTTGHRGCQSFTKAKEEEEEPQWAELTV